MSYSGYVHIYRMTPQTTSIAAYLKLFILHYLIYHNTAICFNTMCSYRGICKDWYRPWYDALSISICAVYIFDTPTECRKSIYQSTRRNVLKCLIRHFSDTLIQRLHWVCENGELNHVTKRSSVHPAVCRFTYYVQIEWPFRSWCLYVASVPLFILYNLVPA
jgi:hypothetical protein